MAELQKFYQRPVARVSAELLVTILAVIFLAIFAISPTLTTMSQLLKDIDDRKKISEALGKKVAALSAASNAMLTLQKEVALLDSVIPNTPDVDGALRRLEKIASDKELIVTVLQVGPVPKEPQDANTKELTTLPITLSVKGTYANILSFYLAISAADRDFTIDTLSVNTQQKQGNDRGKTVEAGTSPPLEARALLKAQYYGVPVESTNKK